MASTWPSAPPATTRSLRWSVVTSPSLGWTTAQVWLMAPRNICLESLEKHCSRFIWGMLRASLPRKNTQWNYKATNWYLNWVTLASKDTKLGLLSEAQSIEYFLWKWTKPKALQVAKNSWPDDLNLLGKGFAEDYYLDAKSQCAGGQGACPDKNIRNGKSNVRLLNSAVINEFTMLTYRFLAVVVALVWMRMSVSVLVIVKQYSFLSTDASSTLVSTQSKTGTRKKVLTKALLWKSPKNTHNFKSILT